MEVLPVLPDSPEVVIKRDTPDFSPGSYTTAAAVVLDEEDMNKSLRSSGFVKAVLREAPQFIAGYCAVEILPFLPDEIEIIG